MKTHNLLLKQRLATVFSGSLLLLSLNVTPAFANEDERLNESIDSLKKVLAEQDLSADEKKKRKQARTLLRKLREHEASWQNTKYARCPKSLESSSRKGVDAYHAKQYDQALADLDKANTAHQSKLNLAKKLDKQASALESKLAAFKKQLQQSGLPDNNIAIANQWQQLKRTLSQGQYTQKTSAQVQRLNQQLDQQQSTVATFINERTRIDALYRKLSPQFKNTSQAGQLEKLHQALFSQASLDKLNLLQEQVIPNLERRLNSPVVAAQSKPKTTKAKQQPSPKKQTAGAKIARDIEQAMVRISAGSSLIGGLDKSGFGGEQSLFINASPVHRVRFKSFRMMPTEVTFEQYDTFAKQVGLPVPDDNGWGRGKRPVINVSYTDANAFAQWLSGQGDTRFSLPSEAQWEYAAWGNSKNKANWLQSSAENINCKSCPNNTDTSQAVAQRASNDNGLYDMSGNVAEWTADCWNSRYNGAPKNYKPWLEGDCSQRVIRGGSWSSPHKETHPTYREAVNSETKNPTIGFRLISN